MKYSQFKNSFFTKTVAIVLVAAFSFYNCDISLAIPDAEIKAPDVMAEASMLSVEDIGIAIDVGTVRSKFTGQTGRTIVHIQDAHCNFEAQSNISRILEQLAKDSGIDMISVEGAEGNVDTAWFRAFPDAEIRREVATYFMKKGEITGAEFFSINSDYDGTIFGAETRDYYVKNLRAFLDMYPYKDSIIEYLNGLKSVGERLKSIIYPPKLRELDRNMNAFEHKELDLSKYAEYLEKASRDNNVNRRSHSNFSKLIDTLEYEKKIDFDIVDGERTRYIDALAGILPKEDMAELVAQSIRFKKGYIKSVDFYSHLRDLAKAHNIPMLQEYPNLFYYYIYSKIYDGIEIEDLFREIDLIERALKAALIKDDVQLKLDKFSEKVGKLISLVNIELTNDDYDRFSQMAGAFSIDDVVTFYGSIASRYNLNYSIGNVPDIVRENLPKMVDFYEIAIKRDTALIENTLAQMEREGKDRSVLIAGGFHTRGMVDLLEKKGVSYVVVTPKITKDVESPYIQVLTNQRTSIEDIITGSAMPGTQKGGPKGIVTDRVSELLAPPFGVGWGVPMGAEELAKYFEPLGQDFVKNIVEKMKGLEQDVSAMNIDLWVMKVIGTVMEEDFSGNVAAAKSAIEKGTPSGKALEKIMTDGTLLATYGMIYVRNFLADGKRSTDELEKQIENIESRYIALIGDLGFQVDRELLEESRKIRIGQQAVGQVLTPEEDGIFRNVLMEKFDPTTREAGKVYQAAVPGIDGFVIQLHDDLVIDLVKAGIPLNKAVNIRPSTYDGKRQMHIDRAIYDRLTQEDLTRIAKHEMAHILIAENDSAQPIVQAWQRWEDKTTQGQEEFLKAQGFDVSDIADRIAMMSVSILTRGTGDVSAEEALQMTVDRGIPVSGVEGTYSHETRIVLEKALSKEDINVSGFHEEVSIVGSNFVEAPEILDGRQYFVQVEGGEIETRIGGEVKPLAAWTAIDGTKKVEFRKVGSRPVVLKIYYSPNETETRAYNTLAAVVGHSNTLMQMKEPIMVHAPKNIFASRDIGSIRWIQNMMRRLAHPDFRLAEYTDLAHFGGRDLNEGYTHVVIGTQTDLTNSLKDEKISSNLSRVRVLPIADNAAENPNANWDFSVEAVSWAVIAGAATPEQVQAYRDGNDFTSPAADIFKFLTKFLKPAKPDEKIDVQHLYMMMPYAEVEKALKAGEITIDDDFMKEFLNTIDKRITKLVEKILFSIPIRPFDPVEALKSRLKVMWSV